MQAVLSHALELFCFCLAIHVLIWRVFPPRSPLACLAAILLFGPWLLLGIYEIASKLGLAAPPIGDWLSYGLVLLLHLALSGVYLNLYTLVGGFSPSIGILERVEASIPHGLQRHELAPPWFNDKNLSGARRENLLATGMIYESGGLLHLSPRGRFIAACFLTFRRFLGLTDVAKG
jgi:hypothetical protein